MSLIKYLGALGYGSRRDLTDVLQAQRVTRIDGGVVRDGESWSHDTLLIDGLALDPPPGSVLMMHKPVGYVCSLQDVPPLIYDLLPLRFGQRRPVIAPVGRLDRDTSGLLLLTDDGPLNHRLTSPRSHVAKTYRVTVATPLRGDEAALFSSGTLRLRGDPEALLPASLLTLSTTEADITLTEGRYHQVRRMFVAVGNHVTALHRIRVGELALADLAEGQWRALTASELSLLTPTRGAPTAP